MNFTLSHPTTSSNPTSGNALGSEFASQADDRRRSIRSALMMLSMICIIVPLPLMGVMGYLVADGQSIAAYYTALAAVMMCVCAIAAYVCRRVI